MYEVPSEVLVGRVVFLVPAAFSASLSESQDPFNHKLSDSHPWELGFEDQIGTFLGGPSSPHGE